MEKTVKEKITEYINQSPLPVFEPALVAAKVDASYIQTYNALLDLVDDGVLVVAGQREHDQRKPTPLYMRPGNLPKIIGYQKVQE